MYFTCDINFLYILYRRIKFSVACKPPTGLLKMRNHVAKFKYRVILIKIER